MDNTRQRGYNKHDAGDFGDHSWFNNSEMEVQGQPFCQNRMGVYKSCMALPISGGRSYSKTRDFGETLILVQNIILERLSKTSKKVFKNDPFLSHLNHLIFLQKVFGNQCDGKTVLEKVSEILSGMVHPTQHASVCSACERWQSWNVHRWHVYTFLTYLEKIWQFAKKTLFGVESVWFFCGEVGARSWGIHWMVPFFWVIKIWVGLGVSSKNHRKMEVWMGKP